MTRLIRFALYAIAFVNGVMFAYAVFHKPDPWIPGVIVCPIMLGLIIGALANVEPREESPADLTVEFWQEGYRIDGGEEDTQ